MQSNGPSLSAVFREPARYAPQRLPAFSNVEQSAVLALSQQFTTNLATQDTATIGNRMLLMRQPSMPVWADVSLTGGWLWGSRAHIASAGSGTGAGDTYSGSFDLDLGGTSDGENLTVSLTSGGPTEYIIRMGGSTPFLRPVLGVAEEQTRPFVLIPPTGGATGTVPNIVIVLSTTGGTLTGFDTTSGTISLTLEQVSSPGRYVTFPVTGPFLISSANFQPVGSSTKSVYASLTAPALWGGFYRLVSITISGTYPGGDNPPEFADVFLGRYGSTLAATITGTTLNFVPSTTVQCVPLFPAIESAATNAHLIGSRCTALSLSMSNVTAVLNKEGVIQAARLPFNITNLAFTKAVMNSVPPAKRFQCAMESGAYFYSPPVSDLDTWLDFAATVTQNGSIVTRPVFNLDSMAEMIAISLNDATVASVTSMACKLHMHLEFRSYSQLWPAGLSYRKLDELHGAVVQTLSSGFARSGPGTGDRSMVVSVTTEPRRGRPSRSERKRGKAKQENAQQKPAPKPKAKPKPENTAKPPKHAAIPHKSN